MLSLLYLKAKKGEKIDIGELVSLLFLDSMIQLLLFAVALMGALL